MLIGGFRSGQDYAIQCCRQRGESEIETLDLSPAAGRLLHVLNDFRQHEFVEALALQNVVAGDSREHNEDGDDRQRPTDATFPFHGLPKTPVPAL